MASAPRDEPPVGRAADPADAPVDPAAMAALVAEQRAHVVRSTNPDARLLYGVWGAVWLAGFGLLWLSESFPDGLGVGWAYAGFAALMAVGVVLTVVHLARRSSGLTGVTSSQRRMFGWTWGLSFGVVTALNTSLGMGGASDQVMAVVTSVVPALVVGALYMAGGAVWGDSVQFGLGAWICVAAAAGALSGPDHVHLVMAVAGGGGLLIGALVYHLRVTRSATRARRPRAES